MIWVAIGLVVLVVFVAVYVFDQTKKEESRKQNALKAQREANELNRISAEISERYQASRQQFLKEMRHEDHSREHKIARFLLWMKDGKKYSDNPNDYPGFFFYEYGIKNVPEFFRSMITDMFVEPASIEAQLKIKKVSELKEILKAKNLPVSGVKTELIKRIVDNSVPNELSAPDLYVISEKGKLFIKNSVYYGYLSVKQYGIDWETYESARKSITSFTPYPRDVAWLVFNQRSISYHSSANFGLLRNTFFNRYQLLMEENRRSSAIVHLLCVFYLDLSGWGNNGSRESKNDVAEFTARTSIAKAIGNLKDVCNDQTIGQTYRHIGQISSYFNPNQFRTLVYTCCEKGWIDENDILSA